MCRYRVVIIYNTLFSVFGSCLASDGDASDRGDGIDCLKASVKLRYAYCTAGWPELSYAVVKYGKTFESCAVLYSPSSLWCLRRSSERQAPLRHKIRNASLLHLRSSGGPLQWRDASFPEAWPAYQRRLYATVGALQPSPVLGLIRRGAAARRTAEHRRAGLRLLR